MNHSISDRVDVLLRQGASLGEAIAQAVAEADTRRDPFLVMREQALAEQRI